MLLQESLHLSISGAGEPALDAANKLWIWKQPHASLLFLMYGVE